MKAILFIAFFISSTIVSAQLDYMKMKDTICPNYCGFLDSVTLHERYTKLLNLDTSHITKGIANYYEDLSLLQYDLHLQNNEDSTLMRLSVQNTERSLYHNPKNERMIWNAALGYVSLDECDKGHIYLEQFRKVCPKKYLKEYMDQIPILLQFCPNDELKKKFKINDKKG